jgi:hypothetical protein
VCNKWNDSIRDDSNNSALDVGNSVVVDLPGVDMKFAVFLSVLYIHSPQYLLSVPMMEGMTFGQ